MKLLNYDWVLESRLLPSLAPSGSPILLPDSGLVPSQIQHAYGYDQLWSPASVYNKNAGKGITVGIVVAYGSSTLIQDLRTYCSTFDLPLGNVKQVNIDGVPDRNPIDNPDAPGWKIETSLDVQMVRTIAPACNIIVVNALTSSLISISDAEMYAMAHCNVVNNSWGAPDFPDSSALDFILSPLGVRAVNTAASGDQPIYEWPSVSKEITSVSGITPNIDSTGNLLGNRPWPQSGLGGAVAHIADPMPGVVIFLTNDVTHPANPVPDWIGHVGGTSVADPIFSATVALADGIRVKQRKPVLGRDEMKLALATIPKGDYYYGHGIAGHGIPIANRWVPAAANIRVLPIPTQAPKLPPKIPPITVTPSIDEWSEVWKTFASL
jgi:hypothetical protein